MEQSAGVCVGVSVLAIVCKPLARVFLYVQHLCVSACMCLCEEKKTQLISLLISSRNQCFLSEFLFQRHNLPSNNSTPF